MISRSIVLGFRSIYFLNRGCQSSSLAESDISNVKIQHQNSVRNEGLSYHKADFNETSYYFENGLRKVYPYDYTHEAYCKKRWIGHTLADVFSNEFYGFFIESFMKRLNNGMVLVNGIKVGPEYILQSNDLITSTTHRHELPVLAAPIKVIQDKDDFVVIEKPHSLPVHPTGAYRHNSALFVLAKEHGIKGLYPNHRIDRLTSGVLIFSRTPEKCREIQAQMNLQQIRKTYVCRVNGDFPDEEIVCDQSIRSVRDKISFCIVNRHGRKCFTKFRKLSYNGKSSVVMCQPLTGRMHQIRVHLQYLGYPIVNDSLYNDSAFGAEKARYGKIEHPLKRVAEKIEENRTSHMRLVSSPNDVLEPNSKEYIQSVNSKFSDSLILKYKKDSSKLTYNIDCHYCNSLYKDPTKKELMMCLHALTYEGDGWGFETDMPQWASSDWKEL